MIFHRTKFNAASSSGLLVIDVNSKTKQSPRRSPTLRRKARRMQQFLRQQLRKQRWSVTMQELSSRRYSRIVSI